MLQTSSMHEKDQMRQVFSAAGNQPPHCKAASGRTAQCSGSRSVHRRCGKQTEYLH